MFIAPFGGFTHIIPFPVLICKCANLIIFFSSQSFDCALNLTEHHLRNIAGASAKDGNDLRRVEIVEMPEIIREVIVSRVDAAAGQNRERNAVCQKPAEAGFQIEVVQFLQKAVGLDASQLVEVVREVVLRGDAADGDNVVGKRQRDAFCAAVYSAPHALVP